MIESESRKRSWSAIGLLLLVNLVALSFFIHPGRATSAFGINGSIKYRRSG